MTTPQAGSADLLTTTTLQVEVGVSVVSVDRLVHMLRRVPGVLLADMDAASGRATVAHDSAVSMSSLIAAAALAGVRATIVADARSAAAIARRTLLAPIAPARRIFMFAAAVVFVLAFIAARSPTVGKTQFLLPILLSSAFAIAFAIAHAAFRRRM